MSTSIAPQPETTTQEQIDILKAEIAELQAQKAARGAWWQKLTAKVQATGGWKHAIWITYAAVAATVATNPEAHQAFLSLWAHVPKWGVDLIAIAAPIAAYFIKPGE